MSGGCLQGKLHASPSSINQSFSNSSQDLPLHYVLLLQVSIICVLASSQDLPIHYLPRCAKPRPQVTNCNTTCQTNLQSLTPMLPLGCLAWLCWSEGHLLWLVNAALSSTKDIYLGSKAESMKCSVFIVSSIYCNFLLKTSYLRHGDQDYQHLQQ